MIGRRGVGRPCGQRRARPAGRRAPPTEHLTIFYLVISVGGALGGLLNGIVAPLLFNGVWEYLLTIALIPLLAAGFDR